MPRRKPKKYKQPSIVSGKSISDILNMDINIFNKLGISDLRKVVGRLVSAVNKRLRRFSKAGISTPATRALMQSGGVLSTKGKDLNELRTEFARGRNFLSMETSSRKGFTDVTQRTISTLRDRGVDILPEELSEVFEVYNDLVEIDPSITLNKDRYQILQDIANMPDDIDINTKVGKARAKYNELYEQQQEEYGKETTLYGVSGFFEI